MSVFKSVLVGVFAGLAAVVLWVLVKAALSLHLGVGAGSIGFAISDFEILLAAIAGYCAGFFWYRRSKQSPT